MKHYASVTLLILFLAVPASLFSQSGDKDEHPNMRPRIGLMGGVQLNMHSASFSKLPGIPNCCPEFASGSGIGFYVGGFYRLPFTDKLSLDIGLNYVDHSAELTGEEDIVLSVDNQPYPGTSEHLVDATLATIGLEPLLNYNIVGGLYGHGGLRFGYLTSASYYQKEEVVDPPDRGVFAVEQSRIRNELTGDLNETSDFQVSALVGLSYEVPLNRQGTLWAAPEVMYNLHFTNVVSGENWKMNALRAGIRLSYRFPKEEKVVPPPPPPPPPPPKEKTYALSANVDATGVSAEGAEEPVVNIRVEEFISTQMRPLLNYVFFEEGSSQIPSRYKKLTPAQAQQFNRDAMQGIGTMPTYYHMLNIVGKRMQENPTSNITLVGTNSGEGSERGNTELSQARADAVKDYLTSTWNIDPGRIRTLARNLPEQPSVQDDPLGNEENRRVEIQSNSWEIIEPLVIEDTVQVVSPPTIRFYPNATAEAGLKDWKLIAQQDGRTIQEFNGADLMPKSLDMRVDTKGKLDRASTAPIIYRLTVNDTRGQTYQTDVQTIDVQSITVKKKRTEQLEDKEIDYYNLILFDFASPELDSKNSRIARFIKGNIKPSSQVKIVGYTDQIGEADFNMRLSEGRAANTARALGVPIESARGAGETQLLYDNSTPEGRFYCRTVTIDVITPVER